MAKRKLPRLDDLVRVRTAATQLDIPAQTLDSAVKQGRCPSHAIGDGLRLVTIAEVTAWRDARGTKT